MDPHELRWFSVLLTRYDMIQLPVVPLSDKQSHWISGHYIDEFAQGHIRDLPVRQALGVSIPGAGVGCCISRDRVTAMAQGRGCPFDADSLTEDYEMGLSIHAEGGRLAFVAPVKGAPRVRSHFPATLTLAVRQKARWIAGIALEGWGRAGWRGGVVERWIRMRDRIAPIAALIIAAAYLALVGLFILVVEDALTGRPATDNIVVQGTAVLMIANALLLLWRLAMRFWFTMRLHGVAEGLRAIPRAVTANVIAMMAARRALGYYLRLSRRGVVQWDKTDHVFPAVSSPE